MKLPDCGCHYMLMNRMIEGSQDGTWQMSLAYGKACGGTRWSAGVIKTGLMAFSTIGRVNGMEHMLRSTRRLETYNADGKCLNGRQKGCSKHSSFFPARSGINMGAGDLIYVFWIVYDCSVYSVHDNGVWKRNNVASTQHIWVISAVRHTLSEFKIKDYTVKVAGLPSPLFLKADGPASITEMCRQRGIPRRGSHTRTRGGQGGRRSIEPQRIPPIAMAKPSSPPLDDSEPTLNNSLHMTRFKFKSKLNKPLISAIVTVIFEEEEDESTSEEMPNAHSPTQGSSDSQSSLVGAFLTVSASQNEASQ